MGNCACEGLGGEVMAVRIRGFYASWGDVERTEDGWRQIVVWYELEEYHEKQQ